MRMSKYSRKCKNSKSETWRNGNNLFSFVPHTISLMGTKTKIAAVLSLLLGIYINYPAPELSPALQRWRDAGQFFVHNGHQIFYSDSRGRRSDGPNLVLIHGFPTSSHDWSKMLPALLDKFGRVVSLDLLGFGFSDKPEGYDYSIMEQASIVESLLAALEVTETHILAHDYGDTVAQEMLARFDSRREQQEAGGLSLLSVCLLNGGIFPETNFPRPTQKLLLTPYLGALLSKLTNFYVFKKGFSEVFGPKTQPTDDELYDFYAAIRVHNGNGVMHRLLSYIAERRQHRVRWTAALAQSSVPVHALFGSEDPVNPADGFATHYRRVVPSGGLTLLPDSVGHYPQWEDPRATAKYYFAFFRTLPYSTTGEKDSGE